MIALATAHPAKFPEAVRAPPDSPAGTAALADIMDKRERITVLPNDMLRSLAFCGPTPARAAIWGLHDVTLANAFDGLACHRPDETVDTVSLGLWVDVAPGRGARDQRVAHFSNTGFKGTERAAPAPSPRDRTVGGHLNATPA